MTKKLPGSVFIFTIILVTLLGAGVIGGLYYYLNSSPLEQVGFNRGPVTSEPVSFNLIIASPEDNILVFSKNLLLSGKTTPSSTVVVSFSEANLVIEVGGSGEFSKTLELDPGVNEITITSFDPLGNSKSEVRTVYFSEEKI